jgi:radical SAM protein with 4Fe4S-binding SPASM domain
MGKILPYVKYIERLQEKCVPISVQLNITNKCACKCLMCGKHSWNLGNIEQRNLIHLLEDLNSNHVESVVFSGGDPLVYPEFEKIIDHCGSMKIGILTAGNIQFKYWDKIIPKINWVRFSIDAADKEEWKKIRGSTDTGFLNLMINLDVVSNLIPESEKKKKVRFNFCKLKGINEEQELKTKQLAELFNFDFMAHETRVIQQYMNKNEHHEKLNDECIIPFIHCVIESDGSVFPCCDVMNENADLKDVNFQYALGNLNDFNWNFFDLWYSEKATQQKLFFYKNRVKECETCPMRYYPANVEYSEQKDGVIFL